MTPGPKAGWLQFFDRLDVRLALVLAVALLPIGVISIFQSRSIVTEAEERTAAALYGATMRAAAREVALIREAQATAGVLSLLIDDYFADDTRCSAVMRAVAANAPQYSLAAYVPRDGRMRCSNRRPFNFAGHPLFERTVASRLPRLTLVPDPPLTGTSIVGVTHPVFGSEGEYLGFISLSLPHQALQVTEGEPRGQADAVGAPLTLVTFDGEGNLLTASDSIEIAKANLPDERGLASFVGGAPVTFNSASKSGPARVYSVVPVVPEQLYAIGSWPAEKLALARGYGAAAAMVFPVVMWAAGLVVAMIAANRLMTRHVRALGRSLIHFAGKRRMAGTLDTAKAPLEIREAAEAYRAMTDTILRDEAALEDIVHQKEVLLREVHHRVKNNLQLIASIMNMQIRRARNPEVKNVVSRLQERVMSLATIHKGLYQTRGVTDVHADELLADIVRQVTRIASGPDRELSVDMQFDDIRLTPDQSVPLALLLTEAVTNAVKYGAAPGQSGTLAIELRRADAGRATLRVVNSVPPQTTRPDAVGSDETGFGEQLIQAFTQQLSGTLVRGASEGRYELCLTFPVNPLSAAEQRSAGDAPGAGAAS